MLWPILVVATISSVLVAIVCIAVGVRSVFIVVPAQMIVSFATTYGISAWFSANTEGLVWTCVAAAVAVPAIWTVAAAVFPSVRDRHRSRNAAPSNL
jgi:hypothetical protein